MARREAKKLVIVGFGDAGLTTAVHLASSKRLEVVGITPKPCHQSAQELGGRLAQPQLWKEMYLIPFSAYRQLDGVCIHHGHATQIDLERRAVHIKLHDGSEHIEVYDVLLIATGCTNGFWRTTEISSREGIEANIQTEHAQIAAAATVAVVGGGPSGVSAAYNLACRFPTKKVHLFCSRHVVLPDYHPKVQCSVRSKLERRGVVVHYGHRADVPPDFDAAALTSEPLRWITGQPPFLADVTIWTIGKARPNNSCIPPELLTEEGFVAVDPYLRVVHRSKGTLPNVFSVGDIAATDAARTSARNNGWALVGRNITASLNAYPTQSTSHSVYQPAAANQSVNHSIDQHSPTASGLTVYRPPKYKWGSITGLWDGDGMGVYLPNGYLFFLPWTIWKCFWRLVQRFLWAGMRNRVDWAAWALPIC